MKHKRLRRFFEDDSGAGLPAQYVDKIHKILAFLQDMESVEELQAVPTWKAHQLTGDRKSTWSLCSYRKTGVSHSGSMRSNLRSLTSIMRTTTERRWL